MLENLNKVDWGSVSHFKGPATDVPKFLTDLVSYNRKAQSVAIHGLFGNIWHHGTVYEATALAVPFLYEILESPSCFEKFSVLWLLGAIAKGSPPPQADLPGNQEELEPEMVWVKKAHDAVRFGVKTALALLGDRDKDLHLPVILLLAALPEEADQIKPLLSALLSKEKNAEARAGLGLALALLGDFRLEAFRSENAKLSLPLIEGLAKDCTRNKETRDSAHQMIEKCLLATVEQQDRDWLKDEEKLLNSSNLN